MQVFRSLSLYRSSFARTADAIVLSTVQTFEGLNRIHALRLHRLLFCDATWIP